MLMLELFFRKGELLTDFKPECVCMHVHTNAYFRLGFPGGFPGGSDSSELSQQRGRGAWLPAQQAGLPNPSKLRKSLRTKRGVDLKREGIE